MNKFSIVRKLPFCLTLMGLLSFSSLIGGIGIDEHIVQANTAIVSSPVKVPCKVMGTMGIDIASIELVGGNLLKV